MLRKIGLCVVFVTAALIAGEARADVNSGRALGTNVTGTFFRTVLNQGATETWTITTTGLSPGSDTVLHVQNAADFTFIAGDDDYGGTLASQVVVPPVGYFRELFVIVRSYSAGSQGTCTVAVSSSVSGLTNLPATFGGAEYYVGDLVSGAYATTVERQGGAADTIMLTVGGPTYNPSHAVAYDDDNGTGLMSSVHDAEACQNCVVVLANWNSLETGTYTADLVWDGDRDSTDWDGDGLGASLEHVIGTADSTADTDQDGLGDGAELLGVEVNSPVKLPTWGADPLQKDVFMEMDWRVCTKPLDPNLCPNGADSGQTGAGFVADADFKANYVDHLNGDFAPGGFRLHLDVGRANGDPSTWYDWGDFRVTGGGAATQLAVADADICGQGGSSPERAYMFHHGISFPPESNSGSFSCAVPGPLFSTDVNDWRTVSHESGHGFGLQHGGRPQAISVNYKPHYRSLMDYLYNYDLSTGFSHDNAPVLSINPTAANEQLGLGTTMETARLTHLRDIWCPIAPSSPPYYSSGKCVNIDGNAGPGIPIGAVDWNRDGTYAPSGTTVQGTVAWYSFMSIAQSAFASNASFLTDPALTWVSVGGSVGSQLWMFGRNSSNQLVWARKSKTALDAGCGALFTSFAEGTGDCAGLGGATTLVPGPIVLSSTPEVAPAAAEYNAQILVVFQGTTGTMKSKLITINNSTGNILYGNDVTILQAQGGIVATGDITALSTAAGVVSVWAPTGSGASARLTELLYQNGAWTNQGNALWTDGTIVVPMYGIGATRGYQDGSSTASTYAAIPVYPNGLVEFVVKSNASPFRWSKVTYTCPTGSFGCVSGTASSWAGTGGVGLPTANPPGTQPMAYGRPGLVYQKRGGQSSNSVGRFYMAFNQGSSCSGPFGTPGPWCNSKLLMTEGNLASGTPASRRLTWITPAFDIDGGNHVTTGVSLVDDLTRDTNLRAFYTSPPDNNGVRYGLFMPIADGIMNAGLKDFDDYPYVQGGLRAALCLEGGTWPGFGQNIPPCLLPTNLP